MATDEMTKLIQAMLQEEMILFAQEHQEEIIKRVEIKLANMKRQQQNEQETL